MKKLDFKSLKGDFFGGITAGVVGLPLCLAFGATSGLGPVAGLYGGIVLGVVAAFFGGTSTLISAPTGPMTVVSALIIAAQIKIFGSVEAAMGAIVFTFVVAGLFQIALGTLKLGKYIDFLPYPVISGFMSGIGMLIQRWSNAVLYFWGGYLLLNYPEHFGFSDFLIAQLAFIFSTLGLGAALQDIDDRSEVEASARWIFSILDRTSQIDPLSSEGKKLD